MEQADPVQQGGGSSGPFSISGGASPVLVGSVLGQSGSLGNSSLNGTTVLYMQDIHQPDQLDQSVAGIFSFDGNGNFSITAMDEDVAGTITQDQPSQGTYSVASNGEVTISCQSGDCPAGFLITANQGFFVSTGADCSYGVMEPQSSASFSNASIAGSYVGGSLAPLDYPNAVNDVAVGAADGLGTFTESSDSSGGGGLGQSSANVASYSMAANGRGTMQGQGSETPAVVYMISPTKWIVLQPASDARVDVYQH